MAISLRPFTLAWLLCLIIADSAADSIHYHYRVVQQYPHSRSVFTQGLEYQNGLLYESAGLYSRSALLKRRLESTTPLHKIPLPNQFFAEGITLLNNQLFQLTWRAGQCFVYTSDDFKLIKQHTFEGEGWGLTNNGKELIMSNGSNRIQFIDPETFKPIRSILVTDNGLPVNRLNELEWVDGLIYANIWQTQGLAIIDPQHGRLVGRVDLSGLLPKQLKTSSTDVLNGIAYDNENQRLFVTGKNWPKLYHIELIPASKRP